MCSSLVLTRLTKANQHKKEVNVYIRNARRRIVHVAAARAWSLGVPWEEALRISEQAVRASQPEKGKGKGHKGKGRKGKGPK